jgi:hypothetical protein
VRVTVWGVVAVVVAGTVRVVVEADAGGAAAVVTERVAGRVLVVVVAEIVVSDRLWWRTVFLTVVMWMPVGSVASR